MNPSLCYYNLLEFCIFLFLQETAQKERWAKLPSLKKNFYVEDPEVANMTEEQVALFRKENNNIEAKLMFEEGQSSDLKVPNPVQTFEQAFEVS